MILLYVVAITSAVTTADEIPISDLCPADLSGNLMSGGLIQPWFYHIGKETTEYDQDWPSWTSSEERSAYVSISNYLSEQEMISTSDDIRSKYYVFDEESLGSIATALNAVPGMGVNTNQPSDCDAACWVSVKSTLSDEINYLKHLYVFRNRMDGFLDNLNANYQTQIEVVTNLLSISAATQVAVTGSGSGSSFTTAMSVAGVMISAMNLIEGVNLAALGWGLSATKVLGGLMIGSPELHVTVNLNNELWITSSEFTSSVNELFLDAKIDIDAAHINITQNYGRLQAFSECLTQLNIQIETSDAGLHFDAMLNTANEGLSDYFKLESFMVLLPAKFKYYGEFQCTDWSTFTCPDAGYSQGFSGIQYLSPDCMVSSASNWATSDPRAYPVGSSGYIVGWMGAKNSQNPHNEIMQSIVTSLDQTLQNVLGEDARNFQYILNNMDVDLNTDTAEVFLSDAVDTISFSFQIKIFHDWCESQKTILCLPDSNDGDSKSYPHYCNTCNEDSDCDSACGEACGSCLSGVTSVLMADNTYKLIKDISIGDLVMDPLTGDGRKVLYVLKPLRNGRKLYQINNSSFSFTKAHPFLSYQDNVEFNVVATIDKNEFLFYMPTWDEKYVQNMNTNTTLSSWQNGAITPVSVESVQATEFDDDDEILYDLLLDFESPTLYIINDGMIVYNEWYNLDKYPDTTQFILGLFLDIFETKDHSVMALSNSVNKDRESINEIAAAIANDVLSFYDIIAHYAEGKCINYTLNVSTVELEKIATSYYLNDLWAIGKVMEEFVARVSPELDYILHSNQNESLCDDQARLNDTRQLIHELSVELDHTMKPIVKRGVGNKHNYLYVYIFGAIGAILFVLCIVIVTWKLCANKQQIPYTHAEENDVEELSTIDHNA